MAKIDLAAKFPQMTPTSSPPSLFRVNGCGVALYGSRDKDDETNTYVATWCLCLLFVPVVALRAYRVARAQRGWYFIGREPLSGLAKGWNYALLTMVIAAGGVGGWLSYTGTPAYHARQEMARAQGLAGSGHLAEASAIYQRLAIAGADQSQEATTEIKKLMGGEGQQSSLQEFAGVFTAGVQVVRRGQNLASEDVLEQGMRCVASRGGGDPRGAIAVLDAVRPLAIDTRKIDDLRFGFLQKLAQTDPTNLEVVVPLASMFEQRRQMDEAKKVLLPVRDRLGDGEGARVLGTVLAHERDYDAAYALLWSYVQPRLDKLHAAQKQFEAVPQRLWDQELAILKNNKGPSDFYEKLKTATPDARRTMIQEYINGRIRNDPEFMNAQQELEHAAGVVPVALNLGIVMLERAQTQPNMELRKTQLEAAEQVFLAIGGVAGQSDEYRVALGEVYYWLGKQTDGRKQFDDLLASKNRSYAALIGVGEKLRDLGSEPEARALAEEAYTKASNDNERFNAASFRSLCVKDGDDDDEIVWLNKADPSDGLTKARLADASGRKAYATGKDADAANQFRAAAAAYSAMPRNSTTLNQTALSYYSLFIIDGDHQTLDRCVDSFQQAVDLNPKDPILLFNAGVTLESAALADVMGGEIDLRSLHETGELSHLAYLYHDQSERDAVAARVKSHPGIVRALNYLETAMVLAPKNHRTYQAVYDLRQFLHDDAALQSLDQRIKAADVDTGDVVAGVKDFIAGTKDEQQRVAVIYHLKRAEDLVAAARVKGGRTAALALSLQAEGILTLDRYTGSEDPEKAVALAEEADRIAPSSGTYGALMAARLFRAGVRLNHSDAAFRSYTAKYNRSLGYNWIFAQLLSETGPLREESMRDPDVRDVIEQVKKSGDLFPNSRAAFEWAILSGGDAGAADKAAEAIRKNPRSIAEQSIVMALNPANSTEAMETNWLMRILGRAEEGRSVVAKVAALGIPVPMPQ
ncbi:MAG TPA: hypothetical protein VFE58_09290 [Tepidisphaeraceae bacterium]|jgi:tetratricopeptide (TPR) repeat protein|nr:hypothetical protein [Tepidisphaeraceae bacterium]